MHVGAAERFGIDHFAGRRLHQGRAAKEDRALFLDDDGLVAHGRHIGATGRAGAHDHGDLSDAERAHACLVVEDTPEVFAVREDLILQGQERAARIDQVDAGQAILERDFLGAQMLFHGHREIGAALDRCIVGDNDDFLATHPADAGNQAGAGRRAVVHAMGSQRRQFEERRTGIEQGADALAWQQLAALGVLVARLLAATERGFQQLLAKILDKAAQMRVIGRKVGRARIDQRVDTGHGRAVQATA